MLAGLAVTAHNDGLLTTGTFSNVSIGPPPPVGLTPVWSGNSVNVAWLPDSAAVTYNVYRSTTPGGEGATPMRRV